jgi:hypothetical protein
MPRRQEVPIIIREHAKPNGLLPAGTIPLQIGGTRHWIIVRQAGYITIGCHHWPLTQWEEEFAAVGKSESYSEAEIAEYRLHIAHCRACMEARGVVDIEPAKEIA